MRAMRQGTDSASWAVALGLSLGPAISNGIGRFAYGLVLPAMRQDLAWTYTQAGWINTANALGYFVGALLALRLVRPFGARRLFVGGMVLVPVCLVASALTHDLWLQCLARLAAGMAGAPAFIAGGVMAATLFRHTPAKNALAIGLYFGGGGTGMLASGLLVPYLLETAGAAAWPQAWLLLAGLALAGLVPAVAAARRVVLTARGVDTPSLGLPVARMLPSLAGYFLFAVGYIVYLTFLVAWMRANGAGAGLVALTWALLGAAVMVSPFLWRPVLSLAQGGGALALSCLTTGVATVLPIVPGVGVAGLLASALVFGLSFFIAPAAVTTFGSKNLPERNWGRSVALFTTLFAVGQTIGPVLAGLIADATASLSLGLAAAAAALVLAAVLSSRQRPLSPPPDGADEAAPAGAPAQCSAAPARRASHASRVRR